MANFVEEMGLLDNIRGIFKMPVSEYKRQHTAPSLFDFGVGVTNDNAYKLTAYYAAIRLRSENIASLPRTIKNITEDGLTEASDHPVTHILRYRPNSYTNDFDFWFTMNSNLDGWGNAYALIERNEYGTPVALHQLNPTEVEVTLVDDEYGKDKWYRVTCADRPSLSGNYPSEDMLHLMLVTFDGIKGVNPVIYNAMSLGKGLAIQKFSSEFFQKGGNIKAVLESDGSLGEKQYENFMRNFVDSSTNFGTPLLEYGIKYKQISVNPVAAQLVQSEVLTIQDIARIMNVPPHMICEMSHATFSNIEHQTLQFGQYSLRPTLKRIECELERKLLREGEQAHYSIKFSMEGLLRGDSAARAAFYHAGINDGWLSRNEARQLENMAKKEGLDEMLYPLNLAVVGEDQEQKQE